MNTDVRHQQTQCVQIELVYIYVYAMYPIKLDSIKYMIKALVSVCLALKQIHMNTTSCFNKTQK